MAKIELPDERQVNLTIFDVGGAFVAGAADDTFVTITTAA